MNDLMQFDTFEQADDFCKKIDTRLGYPNAETKTERYTQPEEGADGKWYVPTNADCPGVEISKIAAANRLKPSEVKRDESTKDKDGTGQIIEVKGVKLTKSIQK